MPVQLHLVADEAVPSRSRALRHRLSRSTSTQSSGAVAVLKGEDRRSCGAEEAQEERGGVVSEGASDTGGGSARGDREGRDKETKETAGGGKGEWGGRGKGERGPNGGGGGGGCCVGGGCGGWGVECDRVCVGASPARAPFAQAKLPVPRSASPGVAGAGRCER